jgi:hypothetical protein
LELDYHLRKELVRHYVVTVPVAPLVDTTKKYFFDHYICPLTEATSDPKITKILFDTTEYALKKIFDHGFPPPTKINTLNNLASTKLSCQRSQHH